MTTELFPKVIEHIADHIKCTKENKVLLILDNHESHISVNAITVCRERGIVLLTVPPHTTNKLQPLDVGINGPFKTFLARAQHDWLLSNPGKVITIRHLARLSKFAYENAFTMKNVTSSFKATGLWPVNSLIFSDENFSAAEVTDQPMKASESIEDSSANVYDGTETNIVNVAPSTSIDLEKTPPRPSTSKTPLLSEIRPFPKLATFEQKKGRSLEEFINEQDNLTVGNFVLVKFLVAKSDIYYAGEILSDENEEYVVKFILIVHIRFGYANIRLHTAISFHFVGLASALYSVHVRLLLMVGSNSTDLSELSRRRPQSGKRRSVELRGPVSSTLTLNCRPPYPSSPDSPRWVIMERRGWKFGSGLGRYLHGITEPISVRLYDPRQGLYAVDDPAPSSGQKEIQFCNAGVTGNSVSKPGELDKWVLPEITLSFHDISIPTLLDTESLSKSC
ncbi:hypothetical protein NQ315_006571 [Exocentrus adspersus]|uniref:G-patch domain-containing protein n=1 Tax=Exocentrus adspersus TaxID=1586481 RepID=A0AAV8VGH2_9CUCU|nr:hypothetical protein NQ315_006571 [Exocentrus adspersus]